MKIAICLSGLVRTYRQTYDNYKQCLIDNNQDCTIDTFISTWNIEQSNTSTERIRRVAWYGEDHPLFPEDFIDFDDLVIKYCPKVCKILSPITFNIDNELQKFNAINLQSILSMTYQIYSCNEMVNEYVATLGVEYDLIVRHRFDTLLPFPIKFSDCDKSCITVPSMMQPHIIPGAEWINDKFAIGTINNMNIYSKWYFNMRDRILQKQQQIQPETTLHEYLMLNNIRTIELGQEFELVRPAGY